MTRRPGWKSAIPRTMRSLSLLALRSLLAALKTGG